MKKPRNLLPGFLAIAALTLSPAGMAAEGGEWLDADEITHWNTAGAEVPSAPPQESDNFEYCEQAIRTAQVPADIAVKAAGWQLYGPIQIYGDATVLTAMANADGMCRPLAHQAFVFYNGEFAGTLSPVPMDSRTDGNLFAINLIQEDYLRGAYQRYEPTDALCCPSAENYLFFTIEEQDGLPVVVPEDTAS